MEITVESPIERTVRVEQVAGMFDLPMTDRISETFDVDVPSLDEDWRIGLIVGPSGSGKSTVAREFYGDRIFTGHRWPKTKAVVDGFGSALSVKDVTAALSAVGFSSPPSWLKPYRVLSNGEQFRADLARAMLEADGLLVFDEFTSVVDRTVAQIGSAAIAKAIRKDRLGGGKRLVAVTCHYDVADWLQPDWVLDMNSQTLARGCLQRRPDINLQITRTHQSTWELFRRHHYLSASLNGASVCHVATVDGRPAAFNAWANFISGAVRDAKRLSRSVVLPDFQGVGIGQALDEFLASAWAALYRDGAYITTSHPAMIAAKSRSPNWNRKRLGRGSKQKNPKLREDGKLIQKKLASADSSSRITGGFKYCGPKMDRDQAEALLRGPVVRFVKSPIAQQLEQMVRRFPGATVGFLARRLGVNSTTVRNHLDQLADEWQTLTRRGTGRRRAYYPAGEVARG